MQVALISQYAGDSAVYKELNSLLREGDYDVFRILVAYTSIGGLKIIEDELFNYLKSGKFLDWIIGLEMAVTSIEAIQYMLFLKSKFPKYVRIRIFTAGNDQNIFHPKIYWLASKEKYSIVIGSSNLTQGGLLSNFEACAKIRLDMKNEDDKKIINEFEMLWQQYSAPAPPIKQENLIDLDEAVVNCMKLGDGEKRRKASESLRRYVHPFAKFNRFREIGENIKRIHGGLLIRSRKKMLSRKRSSSKKAQRPTQLIMDILQETRETQVQIPTDVLKPFFGIKDITKKNVIQLSQILNGNVIRTDLRPFISQANKTHRLEIAGIKGLIRPLIVKFTQLDDGTFDHEIITQSSPDYSALDKLLKENGQQMRKGSRRWVLISG